MKFSLACHPLSRPGPVRDVRADIRFELTGETRIRYIVRGETDALVLPGPQFPGRTDNLWQTSCFEMFLRPAGRPGYFEFNFAPSGQWAAYGFTDERQGMSELTTITPPRIALRVLRDKFEMSVLLSPGFLSPWPEWDLGLSAVIETRDGLKSYWALAHPDGPPDFHHQDCFAARFSSTVCP